MAKTDNRAGDNTSAQGRAKEARGIGEEQFRILVESSPNAVVLAAADGTITLLNRQAEAMFGYTRDELAGQLVDVLVPDRFRTRHPSYRAEFMADPRQRPMGAGRDLFGLRKDGTEMPVEIGLTPVKMPNGIFVLATITDITERKRREEELVKTTAELAQSNEELEQFAHVVTHDLQEPLRMIIHHLRIARPRLGDGLDDETRQSLDSAQDAAVRMQALVRDILAYSLVGRAGRGFATTDMEAVLSLVMRDLAAGIDETRAVIGHDPLPTVKADALLMTQLMQNLLSNAIKFRTAGKAPLIHIGANRERGGWVFSVKDNGIGFDPADAERAFKMFYRLHSNLGYPGTGIGLAICKRIVEYHCGRIWAESQPGQGSTFFFTIPDRP